MAHKSRLGVVVIDCKTDDLDKVVGFWGGALGGDTKVFDDPDGRNYAQVETPSGQVRILLQKVSHDSRVHLDIETDDVEAEVARLKELGATEVNRVKTWVVMEAPSGHRFCVVNQQRDDFDGEANRWE